MLEFCPLPTQTAVLVLCALSLASSGSGWVRSGPDRFHYAVPAASLDLRVDTEPFRHPQLAQIVPGIDYQCASESVLR